MYITDIESDEFMTPTQLKRMLGISIPTQTKMRARQGCFANDKNPLPFIKLGARVLYRKSSIDEWIKANENKGSKKGNENE
ncbi:helix-turn-helix domain-containing protein [Campylobacter hyointestinalis subsp. hyointestinalis]|uniref:helix-turn-helix transcriptional regulator n=1 Tax=Campylobacter hyointestinalis TaxID=198 RepID=UPI000727B97A|nr:helix-turn-helix domain-containing protein [Campylobacter hyointestinalis]QCU00223.1 helix-turn-helix domain-containing protein [Campylobacter hyointestinalis subsp. hyointestinalis]CUU87925.1 Helix-turn-helix domain [Campylobacter hyointestinalis subsp. hyointestinalis]